MARHTALGIGEPSQAEAKWQRVVEKTARGFGWAPFVYHTFDSRFANIAGYPDLTMARRVQGRVRLLFVENKGSRGELDEEQVAWLDILAEIGPPVEVYVWWPWDLEEAGRILFGEPAPAEGWKTSWINVRKRLGI